MTCKKLGKLWGVYDEKGVLLFTVPEKLTEVQLRELEDQRQKARGCRGC